MLDEIWQHKSVGGELAMATAEWDAYRDLISICTDIKKFLQEEHNAAEYPLELQNIKSQLEGIISDLSDDMGLR